MHLSFAIAGVCSSIATATWATPLDIGLAERELRAAVTAAEVDLGYAVYEGVLNATTGLNVFKG